MGKAGNRQSLCSRLSILPRIRHVREPREWVFGLPREGRTLLLEAGVGATLFPMSSHSIDQLRERLPEKVFESDSPEWESARQVFSPSGRLKRPTAVVRPADREEVAVFVRWANETATRFAVRSGGHSFDGFSVQEGTVLLDLRALNRLELDAEQRLSAMPAATVLGVSEHLMGTGRALPCGDCPTVGLGGLVSGGGFGYAGRSFGLTIDALEELTMVCGDGSLVTASATENPDLFWAGRGGGGCAGIVTDMRFRTYPIENVTGVTMGWEWGAAAEAVVLHSQLMRESSTKLDLKLKFRTTGPDRFMDATSAGPADCIPGEPLVHVDGQYLGEQDEARDLLRPFLEHPAARQVSVRRESYHDAVLQLVPLDILRDPSPRTLRPIRIASDFVRGELGFREGEAIVRSIEVLQSHPKLCGGGLLLEPSDGALHSVPVSATAFPHRNADLLLEWEFFHDLPLVPDIRRIQDEVLAEVRAALGKRLTGGRYLNYPGLEDTPEDWWGENLSRLQTITQRHDPNGVILSRLNPAGNLP